MCFVFLFFFIEDDIGALYTIHKKDKVQQTRKLNSHLSLSEPICLGSKFTAAYILCVDIGFPTVPFQRRYRSYIKFLGVKNTKTKILLKSNMRKRLVIVGKKTIRNIDSEERNVYNIQKKSITLSCINRTVPKLLNIQTELTE